MINCTTSEKGAAYSALFRRRWRVDPAHGLSTHRIALAIAISMLAHAALMLCIMSDGFQQSRPLLHSAQDVSLPLSLRLNYTVPPVPIPVVVKPMATRPVRPAEHVAQKVVPVPSQPAPSTVAVDDKQTPGHFRWSPPSALQLDDNRAAQRQSQYAYQRASQAVAILSGMSSASAQLLPVLIRNMECRQQEDLVIECAPEPAEATRAALNRFFNVAVQAHEMKLTGNSVQVQLNEAQRLTLTLR